MSDRNKSFRSHCDIDILFDTENNFVTVEVAYNQELLEAPLYFTPCKYYCKDVVEELERQGILVAPATMGRTAILDNTTAHARNPYISASFGFPLVNRKPESDPEHTTVEVVELKPLHETEDIAGQLIPETAQKSAKPSKRRNRNKKTNK